MRGQWEASLWLGEQATYRAACKKGYFKTIKPDYVVLTYEGLRVYWTYGMHLDDAWMHAKGEHHDHYHSCIMDYSGFTQVSVSNEVNMPFGLAKEIRRWCIEEDIAIRAHDIVINDIPWVEVENIPAKITKFKLRWAVE